MPFIMKVDIVGLNIPWCKNDKINCMGTWEMLIKESKTLCTWNKFHARLENTNNSKRLRALVGWISLHTHIHQSSYKSNFCKEVWPDSTLTTVLSINFLLNNNLYYL